MKVEFELSVDNEGRPIIKFTHEERNNSLEQTLLGVFVRAVKTEGVKLTNPNGGIETGAKSWENYQLEIGDRIK